MIDEIEKMLHQQISQLQQLQGSRSTDNIRKEPSNKHNNKMKFMRQTRSSFNKTKIIKTPIKTNNNKIAQNYVEYVPQNFQMPVQISPSPILDSLERDTSPIDASIKDFNMKEASFRDVSSKDKVCDGEYSFRPMLLRKSLRMAEKLGDPMDRLLKNKKDIDTSLPYDFQPKINKSMKSKSFDKQPRWDKLYEISKLREEKRASINQQKLFEDSLESEHTFQPDISLSQNYRENYQGESLMNFIERCNYWVNKKDQKMKQQKQQLEKDIYQKCTFKPQTQKNKPQLKTDVSDFSKRGFIEFFERIDQAKRKKIEQQHMKKQSNWKNQVTRPQEFNLQTKSRANVKQKKVYNSSKENSFNQMNCNSSRLLIPEVQYLHRELHNWNL